jgi:predicted RNase H-like HicB family nuclease
MRPCVPFKDPLDRTEDIFDAVSGILESSRPYRRDLVRFAVVIEQAENSYAAYVPDLPGCVAVGESLEETKRLIREAIQFHLRGLREEGFPIPEPTSRVEYVEAR